MKYTDVNRITQKLNTRLKLASDVLFPTNTLQQEVSPELVLIVAEEKENYLDLILGQIYELPLLNNHPVLADIIEGFVIADLITVYFQSAGAMSQDTGIGQNMKIHATNLISMLVAGHNLSIPGLPPSLNYPGMLPPKRIDLPGEVLRTVAPNRVIKQGQIFINKSENYDNDYLKESQTINNPFSMDFNNKNNCC